MRTHLALLLVALALTVAGCIDPLAQPAPDPPAPTEDPGAAPPPPTTAGTVSPSPPASNSTGNASGNGTTNNTTAPADYSDRIFCESQSACDFWDLEYHEYVLYNVDTYLIDVLIVPSASPNALRDTATMRAAIDAWGDGIRDMAAPWLADNLTLNVYVLGQDVPPQSAITDPEIIVLAAEYNPVLLFGIGYQLPATPCMGGKALHTYEPHTHPGVEIQAADCEQGGYTCLAINTNFLLGGTHHLYDLVAHEFGHCLGIGHVGDAMDFSAQIAPIEDIMSYQHLDHVHCVSSLNARVLEGLYGRLLGQNAGLGLSSGQYYDMDPREYTWTDCAQPAP